tara:strand:- start:91 stop:210 length:120 start_codon:yes stop_codon:yes gene_type:complete
MEIFSDAIQYLGIGYEALAAILLPAALICFAGAYLLESS